MRESEIEKYFKWAVAANHGKSYKFTSPANKGVSDQIACFPDGSTYFVELKRPGGRVSALQHVFANEMKQMNQKYKLFSSIEEIDAWVLTLNKK